MREPIPVTFIEGKFLQHREFLVQLKQYNMEKNQQVCFEKKQIWGGQFSIKK